MDALPDLLKNVPGLASLVQGVVCIAKHPPRQVLYAEHLLAILALRKAWTVLRKRGFGGTFRMLAGSLLSVAKALPGASAVVEKEKAETLAKIEEFVLGKDDEDLSHMLRRLPDRGLSADEIQQRFSFLKAKEAEFLSGKAFGGVYHALGDALHDVQCKAYVEFSDSNALYPGIFPGVRKFEAEIVSMVVAMLNGGDECCGSLTSGGTESVLLMVKTYRDYFRAKKGIDEPEFIAASSAHACINKACDYFGVKLVTVPVTGDMRMDVAATRSAITRNTIGLYASAPSFPHGVIDPIEELGRIAVEHGIGLHVDNCLGGFLCSFMQQQGLLTRKFDYQVPGVTSMSTDIHKYGLAQKGASMVTYSTAEMRRFQYSTATEWSGGLYCTATMQGSRNGGIIASTWTTLAFNGQDRYLRMAARVDGTLRRLCDGIRAIDGLELLAEPDAGIAAFRAKGFNIYEVADEMESRGWVVPRLQFPACVHVCVSERMESIADKYLEDLRASVAVCRDKPEQVAEGMAGIYGTATTIPDRSIVGDLLKGYLDTLYRVAPGGGEK